MRVPTFRRLQEVAPERAEELLPKLITASDATVALAAIEAAGDHPALRGPLLAIAERSDAVTLLAIAQTLAPGADADGRTDRATADQLAALERTLLRRFADSYGSDKAQLAKALGLVGSADAVAPLTEASKGAGILIPGGVRTEAVAAIDRIQARIGPAAAGRLAVVDGMSDRREGGLSLPRGESGALSSSTDESMS